MPEPRTIAVQSGAVRVAFAVAFLAAPVPAVRLLGADTATAQRVTWLTRMMAVRDGALGVGTLGASRSGSAAGWLVACGVADTVDAVVIAGAIRQGRVHGAAPRGIVVGAAASAALHLVTAVRLRRR